MTTPDLLRRAAELGIHYVEHLGERRPVGARGALAELRAALGGELPESGEPTAAVLDALARGADLGLIASAGPRYFGFVIGGSLPVTVAADWLASAWDQNAGTYSTSPAESVAEEAAVGWLLELLDLPRGSSVGLVTGCQMANFTCLAAARHGVLERAGWDVESEGLMGAPRINLVASAESHVTVDVAMRYLGFGTRHLLRVETDDQGRMRADRLRRRL